MKERGSFHNCLFSFPLTERLVRAPYIATPHSVPLGQRTRGCDGRQEGCESGYYYLHRYLNNTIRLHNSSLPISSSNRLNQGLHRHHRCCRHRCCHHSPWFRCPRSRTIGAHHRLPPPLRRRCWSLASPPYRHGRSR